MSDHCDEQEPALPAECAHPGWTNDTLRCVECGEPMTFKALGVGWKDD